MGKEIERKWIILPTDEVKNILITYGGFEIKDYYFNQYCRLRYVDGVWMITIKGEGTLERDEYEFRINKSEINFLPTPNLVKKRIIYPYKNHDFELNVFRDIPFLDKTNNKLSNLILGEVELSSPDEEIDIPPFFEQEVTDMKEFYGYNLFTRRVEYSKNNQIVWYENE